MLTSTFFHFSPGSLGRSLRQHLPTLAMVAGLSVLTLGVATAKTAADPLAAAAPYAKFATKARYTNCFVPDGASCEKLLVDTLDATQRSLRIQAYSFTNTAIAQAVKRAHDRGVDVQVIVDQSQISEKYTSATYLKNAGIPVVVDNKPAIAHNKVMIFDERAVFTGSFNFTKSAQERNAENGMLVLDDSALVAAYLNNWKTRFAVSVPY